MLILLPMKNFVLDVMIIPVDDPVAWCLRHYHDDPILAPTRDTLPTLGIADDDRIITLVIRRCKLNLLEVRPGRVVPHCGGGEWRGGGEGWKRGYGTTRPPSLVNLALKRPARAWPYDSWSERTCTRSRCRVVYA